MMIAAAPGYAGDLKRKPSECKTKISDYVGFSNFPNQVFRRCVRNGFEFTLMVVGQSGLGKSTFLNSLFLAEVHDPKQKRDEPIVSTVKIETKKVKLIENDVHLTMTFVDTPGFGDLVNNSNCWDPIVKYIDEKFSNYLNEETKIERKTVIEDQRVHLCLYFIPPTGHSIKALDLDCIRNLQSLVNIVPVIAKADTMTSQELAQFKKNIMNDFKKHDIHIYEFPEEELSLPAQGEEKEDYHKRIPFAVIGSNIVKEMERNRKVRVREYPWGIVEVENLAHNDFVALRDMIIKRNLIDLIDTTKNVHYENFRSRQMCKLPKGSIVDECDPFTQLEIETKALEREVEENRKTREKLFKERVALEEQKLLEKSQMLDKEEREYENILVDKREQLSKLLEDINDLRVANGLTPVDASPINSSIGEKIKKKHTFKQLFSRH